MNKLKVRCVESDARDQPLGGFCRVIFPVADDRVANCRKLGSNLILQSRQQRNAHERRAPKEPLDGVSKFGASRFGVALRAQFLKHSFAPKIVHQSPLPGLEPPAQYRQILPHWSVAEKLANEDLSIRLGLCEEQNAGREPVDAMDDQGSLSLPRQSRGKQR